MVLILELLMVEYHTVEVKLAMSYTASPPPRQIPIVRTAPY